MALPIPSPCPPQDARTSPFLLPLSFPPNFFLGCGCRPQTFPFVKGFAALPRAGAPRGQGAEVPSPLALPLQHRDAPARDRARLLPPGIGSSTRLWQQRGPWALLPPWHRWQQQPEAAALRRGVPVLAAVRDPQQLGHGVAVFPRSARGVIAQMGTWGNSHPSPGMVMSQEDSKTNGSLRSSAALQDFSSHQPLHQQRQYLSRARSPQLWEKELSGSRCRCQN